LPLPSVATKATSSIGKKKLLQVRINRKNTVKRCGFTAPYIFNNLINMWQVFVGSGFKNISEIRELLVPVIKNQNQRTIGSNILKPQRNGSSCERTGD
jgi:hypothetical protein